jgi:23S rRNA (adenine2030-N6)-methyltransferase
MLSYLHGFHAGNHADVLKHTVLTAILARLVAKPAPLRYIDTHAGAGAYDLNAAAAQRNREHEAGVGKLWGATDTPTAVTRLLTLVKRLNPGATLNRYPGSPWLARECLRPNDSLYLFELHPTEQRTLQRSCAQDRRVKVSCADGLAGCIGLVPPPERRGLLLIDPSYELRNEHQRVIAALGKAHRRFANGVTAIWYPVIDWRWVDHFERALRATGIAPIAQYELCVAAEGPDRHLIGSGMFIVNPPWQLDDELQAALPWLAKKLGEGDGSYRSEPLSR